MKALLQSTALVVLASVALALSVVPAHAYVLYATSSSAILKINSDGAVSVFAREGDNSPQGIAVDSSRNLYVAVHNYTGGTDYIAKYTPSGVRSVFLATGLSDPCGIAFDNSGRLYVANQSNNTILRITAGGQASVFASTGVNGPVDLAFDRSGNLFVSNNDKTIMKFTPGGIGSLFATTTDFPSGMAFDKTGNLYVSEDPWIIRKFSPGGVGSVFANGSGYQPECGLAFDGAGNLYGANTFSHVIDKFTPAGVVSTYASGVLIVTFLAFTDDSGKPLLPVPLATPIVTTLPASAISGTSAILNGSVNANGRVTTVSFQYGLTNSYGATVTASPAPGTGTSVTLVSAALGGLLPGTVYHYRVVATNLYGTTQGADMTFTTPTDNPDGDNYDNLIEYAFNLSPANGVGSPFFINPSTVSTGKVELSFTRPTGAMTSVTYYLEYSSALGPATSWISIPLTTINPKNLAITPLSEGLETVTIRNLEAREGFVRFRVELDANGDQITDHISYTGVEGWTESAMELGTCTYNNPYQHEAVFTGTVDATGGVTGQTLQFVTSAGTVDLGTLLAPGASYYAEVTAGPNEGQRFDVESATDSALTLATVSDVCSDTPPFNTLAGAPPATLAGNRVAIHRHWTLGELFPITRFFAADIATDADQVQTSAVAATGTYWLYSNGGQPKWVKLGDVTLADQANTVLAPGHGMIVTKRGIGAPLLACGEVRANNFIRPLCAGLNLVGGGYPIAQSATGSGSRQMDVAHGFLESTDPATADMFSVWKGDATLGAAGYDSYYLYNPGSAPKWVKTGDATLAAHDAELLFLGDRSVLIRVQSDLHGYTIPNQSLVPALIAVTQSTASVQSLAAIGSGQDTPSALIAHAFGLDAPGAGALPQGKLTDGNYVIEFTQPPDVTGITYGAECSATLLPGSWTEVPDSGTGAEHVFSVPVGVGGQLFMRLRVTGQ